MVYVGKIDRLKHTYLMHQHWNKAILGSTIKAGVKRCTLHESNRMLTRENKGFFSFEFDSAHVKYGV